MLGTKTDGGFKHLAKCLRAPSITTGSEGQIPLSILTLPFRFSSAGEEVQLSFRQSIHLLSLRDNFSQRTRGVSTSPSHTCGEDRC